MKIPKSIEVAGREFQISYPHIFQERLDVFGHTDFATGKVYITNIDSAGKDMDESFSDITFWHELFHMIDRAYCCNMIGQSADKEDMIEGLAQGLFQVLKSNFKKLETKEEK